MTSPEPEAAPPAEGSAGSAALTVTASPSDTGVVDTDRDGQAEHADYGATNRALSVGEQGGDGRDLRYVAPFETTSDVRDAVADGATAELSFTVWRADELGGRNLVVTALPGGRQGAADFDRDGVEVFRGAVKPGRVTVDVTDALTDTEDTTTFRFSTDTPPAPGDGRTSQINIATAEGRGEHRPTLEVVPAGGATPPKSPSRPAEPTPPPAEPEPEPEPPAPAPEPPAAPGGGGEVTPPQGMSLVWSDEFDGSALNTRVWKPYHSTYGDGNREQQCHTPDNVTVSGGTLKLTARKGRVTCPGGDVREYSSGFLGTRETGTYFPRNGRFEMRARVPHGQGLWPAFWLRHRQGAGTAEVDIMEYFHSQVPGETTATLHLDGRDNVSKKTVKFEEPTATPGWHTWAVDIADTAQGTKFTFSLDGRAYHSYVDSTRRWAGAAPADGTWDIAVNLSVGGNWVGDPAGKLGLLPNMNSCAQGGTPPNCDTSGIRRAAFPATYEVDYVRVYRWR